MANWCITKYVVTGNEKELNKVHELFKELENGSAIITALLAKLNIDTNVKKYNHIDTRGIVGNFKFSKDMLKFETETAYTFIYEIQLQLMKMFPKINIYFYSEEPGSEVYESNDIEKLFFKNMHKDVIFTPNDKIEYKAKMLRVMKLTGLEVAKLPIDKDYNLKKIYNKYYLETFGELPPYKK